MRSRLRSSSPRGENGQQTAAAASSPPSAASSPPSAAFAASHALQSPLITSSSSSSSPSFSSLAEGVRTRLMRAQGDLRTLNRIVEALGGSKDSPQLRAKLQASMDQTKEAFSSLQSSLAELESLSSVKGLPRHEKSERKILENRLAKHFHSFRNEFLTISQTAKTKLEQGSKKDSRIVQLDEEGARLLDEEPVREMELQVLENELTFNHAVIYERHDSVQQMTSDMLDVEEMFKDMAELVQAQGTQIDLIDKNIEHAKDSTLMGEEEVRRASVYQQKQRNKMCCLALLLLLVVLAFLLLFYATFGIRRAAI